MADAAGSEYKVIFGKADEIEKQVNDLAAEGWIVDQVTSASGGMGNAFIFWINVLVTVVLRRDRGQG